MGSFQITVDKELHNNVVNHYPHPIAYRFLLAVNAKEDQEKLQNLLDLYASIVRYCAVLALSDYLRSDVSNPAVDMGILELMDRSSVAQWEGLYEEIVKTFMKVGQSMFVDELKEFYLLPGEQLSTYGFALKSWLSFFNQAKRAHGIDKMSPELVGVRVSEMEELLQGLTFLTEYRLVQILTCSAGRSGMYRFTVKEWMGAQPPVEFVEIVGARIIGQIYTHNTAVLALYHAEREMLLNLYPFLICDLSKLPSLREIEEELFFFNGRQANSASYLSIVHGLDGARVTESYVTDLDALLSKCIVGGPERSGLWQAFAQAAFQGQTHVSLGEIRQTKYEASVYLHREKVEAAVNDFLTDDRHVGFLLIGDSGTGKTNLLAHVAEDQIRQGNIVLFYRPSDLGTSELSLGARIGDTLSTAWTKGVDLSAILSHLEDRDRRLVVIFDGINEDADPKRLLSYLNDLVREVSEYPFVKILISCRSSSWDMLSKMGILDRWAFYHTDGQWEIQLTRFTEEELREVFELYRRQYDLKTTYEGLSEKRMHRVQTLVADPLMLRLVAEVYQGRAIAADVSAVTVFEQYCDSKMSESKDRLLIRQLARKMRDETTDYLILEELWKDEQLAKEVMSHELDSSFVRMVDAGVLQLFGGYLGMGAGYSGARVKFAYDRVHEYLLAEEEIPVVRRQGAKRLLELIEESRRYAPIWGATKSLLMMLSEDETFKELIAQLAPIDRFEVRGILVDALTGIGRENPELVLELLSGPIFLGSQVEAARLVAVRVGCNLNMVDLLADAATHVDAATRQMTAQYIYWFWQKDKRVTQALVEEIGKRAKRELSIRSLLVTLLRREKIVERMYALRALIAITVMISGHLALEPERLRPVALVWDEILKTFGMFRPLINRLAARFVVRVLESALKSGVTFTFDALASFLASPLSSPERALVIKLTRCLEPEFGDLREIESEILELAAIPDILVGNLVVGLLAIHSLQEESEVLRLARQMFRSDSVVSKFNALRSIWLASFLKLNAMDIDTVPPEYIRFFRDELLQLWASGEEPWVILGGQRIPIGYTEYVIITEYMSRHVEGATFIDQLLRLPWHEEESKRVVHIIHALEVAGQYGYPVQALNDMRRWFSSEDQVVHKALVEGLAKVRVTYPDEVDLYLADSPDLSRETEEMPGADWKGAGLGPAFYQAGHVAVIGILNIPTIRRGMLNALVRMMQTAQCLEDGLRIFANWIFNEALPQIIEHFRGK